MKLRFVPISLFLLFFALLAIPEAHAMRWYSPETGRWLSRDPIGEHAFRSRYLKSLPLREYLVQRRRPPPADLYVFVRNNPTSFVDPLGLLGWNIIDNWKELLGNFCCLQKIKDGIDEDAIWAEAAASEWGGIGYENGPEDAYRHCLGGCRLKQLMDGEPSCKNTSFEKIVNYRERKDPHDMDKRNNLIGSNGPGIWGTCADYCSFKNSTGGLVWRPREEWSNRPGGGPDDRL